MTTTGKAARKRFGTRVAAKRSKPRKRSREFGSLPVSASKGNTEQFIRAHSFVEPETSPTL